MHSRMLETAQARTLRLAQTNHRQCVGPLPPNKDVLEMCFKRGAEVGHMSSMQLKLLDFNMDLE